MLILAATPIGNLGDASPRLAQVLASASLIVAEDTRMIHKLMKALEITTSATVLAANEHSEASVASRVLDVAAESDVVVVSDAGMPAISDPGYVLSSGARTRGIPITVIPGPSAGLSALAASGLPTDRFVHEGFIPKKGRSGYFASLAQEPRTMIFFESPHRLAATLRDAAAVFGDDRAACVARELTKMFEQIERGTLGHLAHTFAEGTKGEVVLIVAGKPSGAHSLEDALEDVGALVAEGMKLTAACASVAKESGIPKGELYRASLERGA